MRTLIVSFTATVMLAGCGIYQNITSDYDRSVNFNTYKTYAWLNDHQPHTATPYDNDIIENNIKNYVDHELADRNYTPKVDAPDLLFELVLNNQKKVRTTTTPVYSAPVYPNYPPNSYRYYNPNNYRWNPNGYNNYNYVRPSYQISNRVTQTEFNQSTITINVFDRVSNKMIWTGSARGDVYANQYIQNDIHPAVDKILKEYPVKVIKKRK